MSLLLQSSEDWLLDFLSNWLDIRSLGNLDVAVSSRPGRLVWLKCLKLVTIKAINKFNHIPSSIRWLIERSVSISSIQMRCTWTADETTFSGFDASTASNIDFYDAGHMGVVLFSLTCPLLQTINLGKCSFKEVDSVVPFLRRCPQLETISLEYCKGVTDAVIVALAESCFKLKTVDLSGCDSLTDCGVTALARGCPLLQNVKLRCAKMPAAISPVDLLRSRTRSGAISHRENRNFSVYEPRCKLTDASIIALAAGCPLLETIDLGYCEKLTSVSIAAIGASCHLLKHINLESLKMETTTDAAIAALAQGCPDLVSIILKDPAMGYSYTDNSLTDAGVTALARCCPKLHTVDLSGCQVTIVGVTAIGESCPLLEKLYLHGCNLGKSSMIPLAQGCPLLEEIVIWVWATIPAEEFSYLIEHCPKLRIFQCSRNERNIKAKAEGCPLLQVEDFKTDSEIIAIVQKCRQLEIVTIRSDVTDAGIITLALGSPLLEDIRFENHENLVTDEGVVALARNCPFLHTIDLQGCGSVTDVGIEAIVQGCPKLKTIYLTYCTSLTVRSIEALLEGCPNLMYIDVSDCGFEVGGEEWDKMAKDTKVSIMNNGDREYLKDIMYGDTYRGGY